jgi:hypothetical protein
MAFEFQDPVTRRIASFLQDIGLPVTAGPVPEKTLLPGIHIVRDGLVVEEARLAHCGDLLHEAGHLAVLPAKDRGREDLDLSADAGAEIAAIAWSYAASVHLQLDAAIVFHAEGYRGASQSFIENFREGRYVGVPLLQWMGLTADVQRARELGVPPFPNMLRWLRD